jgi:hypothetical protein
MLEDKILINAMKVGIGTAVGVVTGLKNASAPHLKGIGTGLTNCSASFANGVAKAMKQHKGVAGAISAGTAAAVGHGAIAATVVAAAPAAVATAVAGGAILGVYKLVKYIREER